jgi:hypothetical protein
MARDSTRFFNPDQSGTIHATFPLSPRAGSQSDNCSKQLPACRIRGFSLSYLRATLFKSH